MGVFDTIKFYSDDPRLTCAAGHPLRGQWSDFQTKSLECSMETFVVLDDVDLDRSVRLYRQGEESSQSLAYQAGFRLHREVPLMLAAVTAVVEVHGTCKTCRPIYLRDNEDGYRSGSVTTRMPWICVELKIINGALDKVRRGPADQTREQLRDQLRRGGSALLADDDPLVIQYDAEMRGEDASAKGGSAEWK